MCNVICMNTKCDKRQNDGYCGRAYPCSECQAIVNVDTLKSNYMTYGGIPMSEISRKEEPYA